MVALGLVVDSYIPELAREDVPQSLRGKRAVIFGNIEKIYEFQSRHFLADIAKCENKPFQIGHCFLKHVSVISFASICPMFVRLSCVISRD